MNMAPLLQWIHDTWLGTVTREYSWIFTTGLIIHFIGLSLLLGAMLIVDLRLMGFPRQMPIAAALKFLPIAITGFVMNLLTGIVMVTFDPVGYWLNPAFRIKMILVLIAGLNALWFTLVEHRHVISRPETEGQAVMVKISAALSLSVWFIVMIFGRLIVAFQGSADLLK
jgi:hypothetical protein